MYEILKGGDNLYPPFDKLFVFNAVVPIELAIH